MVAQTGTVTTQGRTGEIDTEFTAVAEYDLNGTALVTTDTYTISNFLPAGKKQCLYFQVWTSAELDTNATPTLDIAVGNTGDADGFLTDTVNAFEKGFVFGGDGALVGEASSFTDTDLTLTVNTNPATGATAGIIHFKGVFRGV